MSNTDFLGRAIEVIKKAIENDTAGDYEKAYQLYYQARECSSRRSWLPLLPREWSTLTEALRVDSGTFYAGAEM